jgi:hypothetical protein
MYSSAEQKIILDTMTSVFDEELGKDSMTEYRVRQWLKSMISRKGVSSCDNLLKVIEYCLERTDNPKYFGKLILKELNMEKGERVGKKTGILEKRTSQMNTEEILSTFARHAYNELDTDAEAADALQNDIERLKAGQLSFKPLIKQLISLCNEYELKDTYDIVMSFHPKAKVNETLDFARWKTNEVETANAVYSESIGVGDKISNESKTIWYVITDIRTERHDRKYFAKREGGNTEEEVDLVWQGNKLRVRDH